MNGMECQRSKESIKLDVLCYCVQYQDGQKRRKPNYSSVDLSEVEWEDKDDTVSCTTVLFSTITVILDCFNWENDPYSTFTGSKSTFSNIH